MQASGHFEITKSEWLVVWDGVEPLHAEGRGGFCNEFPLCIIQELDEGGQGHLRHVFASFMLALGRWRSWVFLTGAEVKDGVDVGSAASFATAKAWGATAWCERMPRPPRRSGRDSIASSSWWRSRVWPTVHRSRGGRLGPLEVTEILVEALSEEEVAMRVSWVSRE